MIVGDPTGWLGRFRTLEDRLVERVAAVWPTCVSRVSPQSLEDHISNMLVILLRKDPIARSLGAIHPQLALPEECQCRAHIKGYLDIAVVVDNNPDTYIAFECKRLSLTKDGGARASLASEYVKDGVQRYVIEQYAKYLPVGAMLGYVLDGNVSWAKEKILNAIKTHSEKMKIVPGTDITNLPAMDTIERFSTKHLRSEGGDIEVRHSLLPFPAPS